MGESSIGDRQKDSPLCLVCGRHGGKTILVTSGHSFVKASGTALSKFIYKVVGEEPCYSMSEVVCEQCYNLLDRLDTYQANASQIQSHITTRYKDTKLELLGHRQRLSEIISNSLDNIKDIQNGTTLNVSNELTITVMHETLPDYSSSAISRSFSEVFQRPEDKLSMRERVFPNLCSSLKKRKLLDTKELEITKKKVKPWPSKPKKPFSNPLYKLSKSHNTPPSYNLDYSTSIKTLSSLMEITRQEKPDSSPVKQKNKDEVLIYRQSDLTATPRTLSFRRHSESEQSHSDSDTDEEDARSRYRLPKYHITSSHINNNNNNINNNIVSVPSKIQFCSTPELTIKKSQSDCKSPSLQQKQEFNILKNELTVEKTANTTTTTATTTKLSPPPPQDQKETSFVQSTSPCPGDFLQVCPQELSTEGVDSQNVQDVEDNNVEELDPKSSVEAALMENPYATSLLQSFLSTSMWFSPIDETNNIALHNLTDDHNVEPSDEVTRESLAVAAGSVKDKKRRQELKNTGQSYVNTKGKLVEAKRVHPQDCSRCPLKCNLRISEADRQSIFAEYWGLADYNLQREYLAVHMEREEKLGPSGLTRTVVLYYITHNNKKMQVCRQFFLKTLDVSEKASRIVLEKKLRGELGTDKELFKNRTISPDLEPSDTDDNTPAPS